MRDDVSAEGTKQHWFDRRVTLRFDLEILLYGLLILLALFTRFYDLESRVMSHDETTHAYFSWQLSEGIGYAHDPMSHGPMQFHLVALSYLLFGDTDATARVPAAALGVLAVGMMWVFRRWLGRTGALVAAAMMLISPYMLYYSRYIRNEALVVPMTMLSAWTVFRYMETRRAQWLYLFALSLSLHVATKETAYLFSGQMGLFLAGYFVWKLSRHSWGKEVWRGAFLTGFGIAASGAAMALLTFLSDKGPEAGGADLSDPAGGPWPLLAIGAVVAIIGLVTIAIALIKEFGSRLRTDFPSLDLLLVLVTLTLPQMAAIPAKIFGWDPLAYQDPVAFNRTVITIIALLAVSAAIGLIWDRSRWPVVAGVYYLPFLILFTTFLTNQNGLASGFVGSLGYWMAQQGVERGSQPRFYYALLQIPVYEFLAAAGSALALAIGIRRWLSAKQDVEVAQNSEADPLEPGSFPAIAFIAFWSLSSLAVYSLAGERMPWITVHIVLPMILFSGWGIGKVIDSIDWREAWRKRIWLVVILLSGLAYSLIGVLGIALGTHPPFQESDPAATKAFVISLLTTGVLAFGLAAAARDWPKRIIANLALLTGLLILSAVTVRAAFRAAYINYDDPTEYLVYAHSAKGPKIVLEQMEQIAEQLGDEAGPILAYDNEMLYPYWWYLRNLSNVTYVGEDPGGDLANYPIVVAGDANFSKVESILAGRYFSYEYMRLWWPNEDYHRLSWRNLENEWNAQQSITAEDEPASMNLAGYLAGLWNHIRPFFSDRYNRHAVWEIWFNRDFSEYAQLTGRDFSLENWSPARQMRLYLRKDIVDLYGDEALRSTAIRVEELVDPYLDQTITLDPVATIGQPGSEPGQLNSPRDLALAADGSLYVADAMNHRIQHFSPQGELLGSWGRFGSIDQDGAPGGTFNEPWGIGVAPDGTIYVADTWNHRIQHFTAQGQFLDMFGVAGVAETPSAFWGPRAVVIDESGRIFVADTGNKRVVFFDPQGVPLGEFGGAGSQTGQLEEPVGLALDALGRLYVNDTWNHRIQIFEETAENTFESVAQFPVRAWYGQSLDNKPYLDLLSEDIICTTVPDGYRVLCFDDGGTLLLAWGSYGSGAAGFEQPLGIAADGACGLWVSDSKNAQLMYFQLDLCQP